MDLHRALDSACDSLGGLVRACDDDELASRLGEPRAMAESYVRATLDLRDAGDDRSLYGEVLRRGHARVVEELADVHRSILEPTDRT